MQGNPSYLRRQRPRDALSCRLCVPVDALLPVWRSGIETDPGRSAFALNLGNLLELIYKGVGLLLQPCKVSARPRWGVSAGYAENIGIWRCILRCHLNFMVVNSIASFSYVTLQRYRVQYHFSMSNSAFLHKHWKYLSFAVQSLGSVHS